MRSQAYKDWYNANRQKRIEYSIKWRAESHLFKRAFLDSLKMQLGCADCGYNEHSYAMDFDHCEGKKEYSLASNSMLDRNWEALLTELSKCDVLCANCHRVRTYERFDK